MKKVYIAGPYTKGCPAHNTHLAIHAANDVAALGFAPFIPHLSHYWDERFPHPYQFWIEWDNVWLKECDILLRLPGESMGSDAEAALAESLGIPVVYTLEELVGAK